MEIDYKKLKDLGMTNDGKKKQFCPECHANRTDKRDKSLSVDWEKCIAIAITAARTSSSERPRE